MKIHIYPEICCEECNEVIHNHMDCPVCKKECAGTDVYIEMDSLDVNDLMECEECGAKFQLVLKVSNIYDYEWEIV